MILCMHMDGCVCDNIYFYVVLVSQYLFEGEVVIKNTKTEDVDANCKVFQNLTAHRPSKSRRA